MGNNHPTQELIQSIIEYVNARYESTERVASYEVNSPQAFFDMDGAASFGAPTAGACKSAPMDIFSQASNSAPPEGYAPTYKSAPEPPVVKDSAPAPSKLENKRSKLKRLFKGIPGARQEAKSSYQEEELVEREACFTDEAVGGLADRSTLSTPSIRSLEDLLKEPGESFATMLFRLIDEKGLTDPDVYNKAGVSRQTFSKIRSKEDYAPSKDTVIALAMALGLTLDEVQDLLNTAGFALSNSSKSDIVISYFFDHGMHDLDLLNEALYELGFAVIGGR